jgi:hypothetical protein
VESGMILVLVSQAELVSGFVKHETHLVLLLDLSLYPLLSSYELLVQWPE